MDTFFFTKMNKDVFDVFCKMVEGLPQDSSFEKARNTAIYSIVQDMGSFPGKWDKYCKNNIRLVGDKLFGYLSNISAKPSKAKMDLICSTCFRFLVEYELSCNVITDNWFGEVRDQVLLEISSFEEVAKRQLLYACYSMPIFVFKEAASSGVVESLQGFSSVCDEAKKLKGDWDKELADKESSVKALEDSLGQYKQAFNFVGLYEGFDQLSKDKYEEKASLVKTLTWLSVAIITFPLIFEGLLLYFNKDSIDAAKGFLAIASIPAISITVLLLYYFRILLFNYKSVKSQILQIDLRKTLCRFIQHYSKHSSDMRKNDAASLSMFESIIFSPIVSDESILPSTYEGVDQLTKALKSLKA